MCIFMYVCTYACVYVCLSVCMYVRTYVWMYVSVVQNCLKRRTGRIHRTSRILYFVFLFDNVGCGSPVKASA